MKTIRTLLALPVAATFALSGGIAVAAEGDLDPSFGAGGRRAVAFDYSHEKTDIPSALLVLPNGRIAVAGKARAGANGADAGAVAVLTPAGSLWTGFGDQGRLRIDQGISTRLHALAVRSDGRFAAGGESSSVEVDANTRGQVFWFDATGGNPNRTDQISVDGRTRIDAVAFADDILYTAASPVTASGFRDWRLYRYAGSEVAYDGSWPNSATTTNLDDPGLPADDTVSAIVVRANGDVVIAGTQRANGPDADFAVKRYTATGVEAGFGTGGVVTFGIDTPGSSMMDRVVNMVVDAQNRVVLCGIATHDQGGVDTDIAIARLLPNGQPDPTFGTGGLTVRSFIPNAASGTDLVGGCTLDPQGRLLVVGTRVNADATNVSDTAVLRLLPSGFADGTFASGGVRILDLNPDRPGRRDRGYRIALQDGRMIVLADRQFDGEDVDFVVARLQSAQVFTDGFE